MLPYHRRWPDDLLESAQRVERLSAALNWTRQQLADHCGVTMLTVQRWELMEAIPCYNSARHLLRLEASLP